MEAEEQEFAEHINHRRLVKAYLRLAAETKKMKENPAVAGVKGEAPHVGRTRKKSKLQPPEQLRMF